MAAISAVTDVPYRAFQWAELKAGLSGGTDAGRSDHTPPSAARGVRGARGGAGRAFRRRRQAELQFVCLRWRLGSGRRFADGHRDGRSAGTTAAGAGAADGRRVGDGAVGIRPALGGFAHRLGLAGSSAADGAVARDGRRHLALERWVAAGASAVDDCAALGCLRQIGLQHRVRRAATPARAAAAVEVGDHALAIRPARRRPGRRKIREREERDQREQPGHPPGLMPETIVVRSRPPV